MLTHSTVGKNVQQYLHPEGTNYRPATGNVNQLIKMLSKVQGNIYTFSSMLTATHKETYIGLLPFFHSYGMVGLLLSAVESGSKLVTLPRFDVPTFLKAIDDHQVENSHHKLIALV